VRQFAFRNGLLGLALIIAATPLGLGVCVAEVGGSKVFDHIFVIVLENHDFEDALDAESSPFMLDLSHSQGLATHYSGVAHPSLPNYLAMLGGDEFGIRDDAPSCFASDLLPFQSCHHIEGESLVDQLEAAGLTFALYAETLPAAGSLTQSSPPSPATLYAQKHNPFVYFDQIVKNPSRLEKLKPLEALLADLSGKTPNFAFIVPNQCHDGHGSLSCKDPVRLEHDFDDFVKQTIGAIRASPNWTQNSAIVVTFDEGESRDTPKSSASHAESFDSKTSDDNRVATIVVTDCRAPGTNDTPLNHYSLLATIEDGFRLPRLRKALGARTLMNLFDRPCR
jgi:hypothetical protein